MSNDTQAMTLFEQAHSMEVKNTQGFMMAKELLLKLHDQVKDIESKFEDDRATANTMHKEVTGKIKKETQRPKEAMSLLKSMLGVYVHELDQQHEQQQKLANEQQKPGLPAVIVPSNRPPMDGITTRTITKAKIVDEDALLSAMANGTAPRQCAKWDMVFINQNARSMGKALSWPGIEVYTETSIIINGGKSND